MDGYIRLAVFDDVTDMRMVLRTVFSSDHRFRVVAEAADAEEAVEVCAEFRPDAIVVDLDLLILDGFEAMARIREVSAGTHIVVTAERAEPVVVHALLREGAAAVVSTMAQLARLPDLVAYAIGGDQPSRSA